MAFGTFKHIRRRLAHYFSPAFAVEQTKRIVAFQQRVVHESLAVTREINHALAPHTLGQKAKGFLRRNGTALAYFNTAFTGVVAFVVSFVPVVGSIVDQAVAGVGAAMGKYLGGVEARGEGLHGADARREGRRRESQAFLAGEAGATFGALAGAVAGAGAGATAAASGGETGSTAAENAGVQTADQFAGEAGHINLAAESASVSPTAETAAPETVTGIGGGSIGTPAINETVAGQGIESSESFGAAGNVPADRFGQITESTLATAAGPVKAAGGILGTGISWQDVGQVVGAALPFAKSLLTKAPAPPNTAVIPGSGTGTGAGGGGSAGGGGDPGLLQDLADAFKGAPPLVKAALGVGAAVVAGLIVNGLSKEHKR
jgi:hypothetical protein